MPRRLLWSTCRRGQSCKSIGCCSAPELIGLSTGCCFRDGCGRGRQQYRYTASGLAERLFPGGRNQKPKNQNKVNPQRKG
jgi:hypothetical protein